jgi:LysM repeat protein
VHIVREGECLSVIGERYGVSWPAIAARNGVQGPDYVIYPGHVLALG